MKGWHPWPHLSAYNSPIVRIVLLLPLCLSLSVIKTKIKQREIRARPTAYGVGIMKYVHKFATNLPQTSYCRHFLAKSSTIYSWFSYVVQILNASTRCTLCVFHSSPLLPAPLVGFHVHCVINERLRRCQWRRRIELKQNTRKYKNSDTTSCTLIPDSMKNPSKFMCSDISFLLLLSACCHFDVV